MLESIQNPCYGPCPTIDAPSSIVIFFNKINSVLLHMLSPEDTTENGGHQPRPITPFDDGPVAGAIKALFWMAVAIGMALLLGSLN